MAHSSYILVIVSEPHPNSPADAISAPCVSTIPANVPGQAADMGRNRGENDSTILIEVTA
jgi:hypothetical protein